jgi:guanylate kinase
MLDQGVELELAISATSRSKRECETGGKDYHFLSIEEFKQKITEDEFIEFEEVYHDTLYGTPKSELQRITQKGRFPIFEIDVKGAKKLKDLMGDNLLTILIVPESLDQLKDQILKRKDDKMTAEKLEERLRKADFEIPFGQTFADHVIENPPGQAMTASAKVVDACKKFLKKFIKLEEF